MAEQEKRVPFPQLFSELGTPWYGAAKALTAWYIDTNEQLAKRALDFQERTTSWAKDTPLAPFFSAQHDLVRKFVEGSATMARRLWQIEGGEGARRRSAG